MLEAEALEVLLEDSSALRERVLRVLFDAWRRDPARLPKQNGGPPLSSVLLLLGMARVRGDDGPPEVCVILNKRSKKVKQPGDLCCPGGSVESNLDRYLGRIVAVPGLPLARWPYWDAVRRAYPEQSREMGLLLATGLREGWEEMRLNPFGIRYLGPLPPQRLAMFRRVIYPMAGWVARQDRFVPGWEVERIVPIPLSALLDPANYAVYRLVILPHLEKKIKRKTEDFPCFRWSHEGRAEILWGVTYRIVSLFLRMVFDFTPPDPASLPHVTGMLEDEYVYGGARKARGTRARG